MKATAATVGTFDGFHTGHLHLLGRLAREAAARGLEPMAVTFDVHPLTLLRPGSEPPLLLPRRELPGLLADRIGRVETVAFDRDTAALTACGFMERLRRDYGTRLVVMGYDNSMGSDRPASREDYLAAARRAGVELIFDEPYVDPATGLTPSSSLLRRLLALGRPDTYAALAGRPFRLEGTVERGLRNGHRLGFPTLNLRTDPGMALPAPGVYAGSAETAAGSWPAVINIGDNPTVAAGRPVTVEAHAIGADLGELYGSRAAFTFSRRLRDGRRFASLEELRDAIAADIAAATGRPV